jgi:hypothetical protein
MGQYGEISCDFPFKNLIVVVVPPQVEHVRGVDEQEDGDGGGLPLRAGPLQPREQGGGARDDTWHQGGELRMLSTFVL